MLGLKASKQLPNKNNTENCALGFHPRDNDYETRSKYYCVNIVAMRGKLDQIVQITLCKHSRNEGKT